MTKPASRLITLIMLLQRHPNQKAAALAQELGISVRTLHRYFEMLDDMGIPVYTDRGPHGGFSLVRGYKMPPLVLSPEEATAISLGTSLVEDLWGPIYRDAARAALAKLDNLLPDEQRSEVAWSRRSLVATGFHRSDMLEVAPLLATLRQAIRDNQRVRMTYHSTGQPAPDSRDLDPYALVHRWGWWYVAGFCHRRLEIRTFRVDRIRALAAQPDHFAAPVDFDIREYLAQEMQARSELTVRLRFDPQAVAAAQSNRAFWETMQEQPDGSLVVTMTTPDLFWAASTALAYGPIVTVLEPEELRQIVAGWAAAIVKQYQ